MNAYAYLECSFSFLLLGQNQDHFLHLLLLSPPELGFGSRCTFSNQRAHLKFPVIENFHVNAVFPVSLYLF